MTSSCILGFQATRPCQRLGLILFILCLLYVGESQSISEAQQCPIGQVAGNPCRGRFNTERKVTWTSATAAKKKTTPLTERPIINTEIMRNGFEVLVWAIFPQMFFEFMINTAPQGSKLVQTMWMAEKNTSRLLILTNPRRSGSHGPVVRGRTFYARGCWSAGSNSSSLFSPFFYSLAFYCLFSLLTLLASRDFCENVFLVKYSN